MKRFTISILFIFSYIPALICINTSCTYNEDNQTLLCEDYINLNGLTFTLTGPIKNLVLKPSAERANSFGEDLIVFFDKIKSNYTDDYNVHLENFIDFDINFNPFVLAQPPRAGAQLSIDRSVLEFKSNGLVLTNCASYVSGTQLKMFAMFDEVRLEVNTIYRDGQCPIVFGDAMMSRLVIEGIDYADNSFSFAKFTGGVGLFRSQIERVEIAHANLKVLDTRVLNTDIFRQTREVSFTTHPLWSHLIEIESDTFNLLRQLRRLELSLINFRTFFFSSNGEWLKGLNPDKANGYTLYLIDQEKKYEFPNEDFCAFSQLETSSNKVVTIVDGKESLECTCTLAYLIQNADASGTTQTAATRLCFVDNAAALDEQKRTCNFGARVQECNRLRQTTRASPTSTSTAATTSRLGDKTPKVDNTVSIVFGVIGIVTIVVVVALGAWYFYYQRRELEKKKQKKTDNEYINIVKYN